MHKPGDIQRIIHRRLGGLVLAIVAASIAGVSTPGCGSQPSAPEVKPGAQSQNRGAPGARPNVLFILIDTLRADRLGCYGNDAGLTPVMDSIAAEGVVFERAIAPAPWTLPSVASLFSGVYPSVHGANQYQTVESSGAQGVGVNVLPDAYETLAERAQAGGCATAGFVANIFLKPKFGLKQGFAFYDDSFVANDTPGSTVNAAALNWLRQRPTDRPFFLYLHYMDVHAPYTADDRFVEPLVRRVAALDGKREVAPEEFHRHPGYFRKNSAPYVNHETHKPLMKYAEYWQARYDAGVAQIDFYIGELRSELQRMGVWDDLYVVITADHGEALGEHRVWTHGLTPHQDQLHVPMILRWPRHLRAGLRVPQSVRLFDLMPTVLEHLGLPAPKGIQADSLAAMIRGDDRENRVALAEAVKESPRLRALVAGRWKLIHDEGKNRSWLFDLDVDPGEQSDLASEHEQVVSDMRRRLAALVEENRSRRAAGPQSATPSSRRATPEEIERMKALGYAGGDEDSGEDEPD